MDLKKLRKFRIDKRSGYSIVDVLILIRLLEKKPMGRFLLIRNLGLGEATVKTMIKKLGEEKIIKNSTKGQILTGRGMRIAKSLNKKVSGPISVKIPDISKKPSIAVVVKNAGNKVKRGIEQRDEGVKFSVDVTTLIFDKNETRFPGTGECFKSSGVGKVKELGPGKGDVILIVSGKNHRTCVKGGMAAALTLV